jgi:hypothetical protein
MLCLSGACVSTHQGEQAPNDGSIVVHTYWLSDTTKPTGMLSVFSYEGTPAERGALLVSQRVDTANSVTLTGLPTRQLVLTVASIGFDRQLIPIAIRRGCPDTLTVYMPLSYFDSTEPRPGRWRVDSCRSGA